MNSALNSKPRLSLASPTRSHGLILLAFSFPVLNCMEECSIAMAELVASMLVEPLVSMVMEKASSYLLDKYKVMEGMEEHHKILKRKLPAILDVIADAEKQSSHRKGAKAWLEELKTVAYDANDVFDEFYYEALRRQAKKNGHISKLGAIDAMKLLPTHNRVAFRYRMSHKIRQIVETIEVLVAEMNAFGFKYQEQALESKLWRQTDSIIVDPDNIISRSREKESREIVQILTNKANTALLTVLPIFGMGGLGKTTLAQLVYNDSQVQKRFELRRWVCVSDEFDVCALVNKICETSGEKDLDKALKMFQQIYAGKRYLLVLDDVWNNDADKWEKLKACLQQGGIGSFILTTTREKSIAQLMQTTQVACNIEVLANKFIKEIIEKRAFGSQERPAELVNMVNSIVERCVGSPLAAKALGSVLRNKNTVQEWQTILQGSPICTDETGILPILKLSYDDLPSDMKQCFAFCAVFPKDYEIDIDMVIELWMANGFILEKKGAHIETTGKRIFNEIVSRSFFQDIKKVTVSEEARMNGYYPRTTFKIHDLMHDVALSVMEREVVTITEESSSNVDLPDATRHLHFSCYGSKTLPILNHSMKKMCLPIQTLMAGSYEVDDLHHLSKYSSLRALQLSNCCSMLMRPKHLPHLRYLDLSESYIKALPEEISLLYNLQTLNLTGCECLDRLPKQMKYMTALRHLYTHGCVNLECMPPELGALTSLQTLTYFVVGSSSDCSNLGELQHMNNIGGSLLLSKLENVKQEDAEVANLVTKKELRELSLSWTTNKEQDDDGKVPEGLNSTDGLHDNKVREGLKSPDGLRVQDDHKNVLECLKSPDRLQALRIYSYQGSTFPMWMGMLQNIHELHLNNCNESTMLPPLCRLTALEVLCLYGLKKLQCLCSGGTSFGFPKLKLLKLKDLEQFTTWCERNWGAEMIIFPQLEKLTISRCTMLTALLEAPLLQESNGGGNDTARSAFPTLKVLKLKKLESFRDWGAVDAQEQPIIFPQLEELSVNYCQKLIALPVAPPSLGGSYGQDIRSAFPALKGLKLENLNSFCEWEPANIAQGRQIIFPHLEELSIAKCEQLRSLPDDISAQLAFPELKELYLYGLERFNSWGEAERAYDEQRTFPKLETVNIHSCPKLTTLPKAPKLLRLDVDSCNPQIYSGIRLCINSLSNLRICYKSETMLPAVEGGTFELVDGNHKCPVEEMLLWGCDFLFCPPAALELWPSSFVQLQYLTVRECDALINWPENEFQSLVSLRMLGIWSCNSLTGYTQAVEQPQIESLSIRDCASLVRVEVPASLKKLDINDCGKLEHILVYGKQRDHAAPNQVMGSTDVQELSSSASCLESLDIRHCELLSEVLSLPPSISYVDITICSNLQLLSGQLDALKTLRIWDCDKLRSVKSCSSGGLPSLELLSLWDCESLASLPNGPRSYSSLGYLLIQNCPGIKSLPSSLQRQLPNIEETDLDARYQGAKLLKPKTWKYAISGKQIC